MLYRATNWLTLSIFLLIFSVTASIAESRTGEKKTTDPAPAKKEAKIEGFRSAKFGMKSSSIFKAISKDFNISKKNIKLNVHPVEQTTRLEITVPKLLEIGGTAKINYILGFKSKRLTQVNIVWGRNAENEPKKKINAQDVVNVANFLRNHLIKRKYKKEGLVANTRMNDAQTMVFRGRDKKNRMALLLLNSPKGADAIKSQQSVSLALSYISNPDKMDIFTIKEDDF